MNDELKRLITECWRSRLGRTLFFLNLLISMACVGYLWSNITSPYAGDVRKLFFVLNWFPMFRLEAWYSVFNQPYASRLNDGLLALLCSVPCWLYGYGAEVGAAKIRELLGHPSGRGREGY